jgi:hypothetical protein
VGCILSPLRGSLRSPSDEEEGLPELPDAADINHARVAGEFSLLVRYTARARRPSPEPMTAHDPALSAFTPKELRKLRSFKTPYGIQKFLDDMPYHLEDTAWSPRKVLAEQSSHCLEGAIFAAAALRAIGYPPLLLDFEADHDTDHVIAIFRQNGGWGAVAKSNYAGCRWREPIHRTLRELALTYFNIYFNMRRERTLRRYSVPVNLKRFDRQDWMTTEKPVWFIVYHLFDIKHFPLLTKAQGKSLQRLDERLFQAECLGKAYKTK